MVKKLEQYEEIDFPKCLPSVKAESLGLKLCSEHVTSPAPHNHQLLYAAAAARVQAEVEEVLSRESVSTADNGTQYGVNTRHLVAGEGGDSHVEVAVSNGMDRSFSLSSGSQKSVHENHTSSLSPAVQGLAPLVNIPPAPPPITLANRKATGRMKFKKTKRCPEKQPKKAISKGASVPKRRKGESDPNAPKKPSNAFFWFCQARRARLQEKFKGEGSTGQHDLTKALAKLWGETLAEEKKVRPMCPDVVAIIASNDCAQLAIHKCMSHITLLGNLWMTLGVWLIIHFPWLIWEEMGTAMHVLP